MKAEFLPVVVDVVAVGRPRAGDPISEPYVIEFVTADDGRLFVPMSVAAAQALVQLLDPDRQDNEDCSVKTMASETR